MEKSIVEDKLKFQLSSLIKELREEVDQLNPLLTGSILIEFDNNILESRYNFSDRIKKYCYYLLRYKTDSDFNINYVENIMRPKECLKNVIAIRGTFEIESTEFVDKMYHSSYYSMFEPNRETVHEIMMIVYYRVKDDVNLNDIQDLIKNPKVFEPWG